MKTLAALALTTILTLLALITVPAQSGSLDTTYGSAGISTQPVYGSSGGWGAIDSWGRSLVLMTSTDGTVEIARFNADGSPDLDFGGGDAVASFNWVAAGGRHGTPRAITLQLDDGVEKIVIAGWTYVQTRKATVTALRVDRFMPDGSLDATFDFDGTFIFQTGYAKAVATQPDPLIPGAYKLITIGGDTGGPRTLVRLNSDGGLDSSFGNGGIVDTANILGGEALVLQPDGAIVAAGTVMGKGQKVFMGVARFNAEGALDTSFGTAGRTTIDFYNSWAAAFNVRVDPAGRIIVGGHARSGDVTTTDIAVARLSANGQLDVGFSLDGKATYDFAGLADYGFGLALQSDGKVLCGGESNTGSVYSNFAMVRFDPAGNIDSTFGPNGGILTDIFGLGDSWGRSILLQPNPERIIITGAARSSEAPFWHAAAAGYLP
jgi:uncharacterized delta-60 repeat protein